MHYKNGTEAKEGDAVILKRYNGKIMAGVLHNVSGNPECKTCNGTVAIPCPGGIMQDSVTIGEIYSAADGFNSLEPRAGLVA